MNILDFIPHPSECPDCGYNRELDLDLTKFVNENVNCVRCAVAVGTQTNRNKKKKRGLLKFLNEI